MDLKPLGYLELIARFRLDVVSLAEGSYLLSQGHRRSQIIEGRREEYYPPRDNPGEEWTDHLLFALKHEGVNLEVLAALFQVVPIEQLTAWIDAMPTSRYTRIAWFLYEWLLQRRLPLSDLKQGNYVPVVNPEQYYTLGRDNGAIVEKRQRVVNNLPGTPDYSPSIRRTDRLRQFEELRLDEQAATLVAGYPAEFLYRAVQYLYARETRSSYAIEHLTTTQRRTALFIALLQRAGSLDCFNEAELVRLQNRIVDDRYAASSYRNFQNYVGQSLGPARELIHYVPPKPEDLAALMQGWMTTCRRLQAGGVHPVVTASVAGFGFVFLHPFDDGNGRIHRFLVHHVLAAAGFSPPGVIFPVSATMLKHMNRYDAALEAYSAGIAQQVEYRLDTEGAMQVTNDTVPFYRYPDLTRQTEVLFGFIEETIRTELQAELEYLAVFDGARRELRNVVDMPDRKLDLFMQLCIQGKGSISKTKRATFSELDDTEISRMEEIVRAAITTIPRHGEPIRD